MQLGRGLLRRRQGTLGLIDGSHQRLEVVVVLVDNVLGIVQRVLRRIEIIRRRIQFALVLLNGLRCGGVLLCNFQFCLQRRQPFLLRRLRSIVVFQCRIGRFDGSGIIRIRRSRGADCSIIACFSARIRTERLGKFIITHIAVCSHDLIAAARQCRQAFIICFMLCNRGSVRRQKPIQFIIRGLNLCIDLLDRFCRCAGLQFAELLRIFVDAGL